MHSKTEFLSGRPNGDWDWKEPIGVAMNLPHLPASHFNETEESLLCNYQPIYGNPGRDALMLGHKPEALTDVTGFNGIVSPVNCPLASFEPVTKKLRASDCILDTLHAYDPSTSSTWKFEDEAFATCYPCQTAIMSTNQHCHMPATLPYGDPPRSFLTTISSLEPYSNDSDKFPVSNVPFIPFHAHKYDLHERGFSSPSESETLTTDGIPRIESTESGYYRYGRRATRSSANSRRSTTRSRGVTMCLRTLLRQLLAGTGWIMDSSISKDQATRLIRKLIGNELDSQLKIELSPEHSEGMTSERKEMHFARVLPELMSLYVGKKVSLEESQEFIKRDKGPYHLTPEFVDLLQKKPWPPVMENAIELREFGCYRQGEARKRARTSYNDSVAQNIS